MPHGLDYFLFAEKNIKKTKINRAPRICCFQITLELNNLVRIISSRKKIRVNLDFSYWQKKKNINENNKRVHQRKEKKRHTYREFMHKCMCTNDLYVYVYIVETCTASIRCSILAQLHMQIREQQQNKSALKIE